MDVLIVEDDATTRRALEQILEDADDLDVDTVAEGHAAIEAVTTGSAEVVVLDYQLPDITGLEVLARLRELDTPPAVVFLTGEGDESVAYRALSQGAVDYLVKDIETYRRLPSIVRNAHDAWAGVEGLVRTGERSSRPSHVTRPAPAADAGELDRFLRRSDVQGLVVHDARGEVVLSSLDGTAADVLATRSAALNHQTDQLAEAADTETRGVVLLLKADEGVIARLAAPRRLQLVALFDASTTPAEALDLVSRASRIVQDELSGGAEGPSSPE